MNKLQKQRRREGAKRRWSDPEQRRLQAARLRRYWRDNPDAREALSQRSRAMWGDGDSIAAARHANEMHAQRWLNRAVAQGWDKKQDPLTALIMHHILILQREGQEMTNQERRRHARAIGRLQHRINAMRKLPPKPTSVAKSEAAKRRWQDPVWRAKTLAAHKAALDARTPEQRQDINDRKRAGVKEYWETLRKAQAEHAPESSS